MECIAYMLEVAYAYKILVRKHEDKTRCRCKDNMKETPEPVPKIGKADHT
jgi:hypothetical protein